MQEVLIYGGIDECTSAEFIEEINEALALDANSEITVRVNTPGGSPEYAWGMIAKFAELKGKKMVKNDGKSHSMGLYFNCYVENASALDVTQFLLHRAAYPDWIEKDPEYFSEAMRTNLENINKNLRKAFEAKIDVAKFEKLKNVTVNQVFAMDSRIDVMLTAKEAKQIGLINEITTITPSIKAEIESYERRAFSIAAKYNGKEIIINQPKNKTMTIETLKAEHPSVYAQVLALGVAQEKDRTSACLVFIDADAKGVKEAIASGNPLSATQMAEFTMKAVNAATLTKLENENPEKVTPTANSTEVTAKEKEIAAFEASLNDKLNIK
jgi:ATP-dependent protease ClpP protease subunit